MSIESSVAFVLAMSIFVASPGPGVMGCLAVAVRRNLYNSTAFITGMVFGDIVYLMFAVFGLTAIAQNFGSVFYLIRIIGGVYLLYLAYKLWTSRLPSEAVQKPAKKRGSLLAGLFITLSNPKVIIFYCSFLPNFMDLERLTNSDIIIVCLLVAFVISTVMGIYTYISYKTGQFLGSKSGRSLNRVAGGAMAATGFYMITKN